MQHLTPEARAALVRALELKRQAQEMMAFRPFLTNPATFAGKESV